MSLRSRAWPPRAQPTTRSSCRRSKDPHRDVGGRGRRIESGWKRRGPNGRGPLADHPTNGDEQLYPHKIASYSKGLPHNHLGEVDLVAYRSLTRALRTGRPADFERILLGGGAKLVNPQAGLAFDMQGPDSHSLTMSPAPAFSSAEEAAEIAEDYWMALLRDVPFSEYDTHPLAHHAATDLSRFSDFRGPQAGGRVTPETLFRGETRGDLTGPYVSQFLWRDTPFGAERVVRQMQTAMPGIDHMTDYAEWLAVQDGELPGPGELDPVPRYIRNGRDLGEWVHIDVLFQAYFNALLVLLSLGAPFDERNPYVSSRTQMGFGTLGNPYVASVLCAVATRALKAVWYQKWHVHRRLRPEVFAARVHNHLTGAARYPIHLEILHSAAVVEVRARTGSYLLPMGFPEGSPLHPAYGAGHATVGGACVTVLKAFFDEAFVLPDPVEASADGLSLRPYTGPDLTVGRRARQAGLERRARPQYRRRALALGRDGVAPAGGRGGHPLPGRRAGVFQRTVRGFLPHEVRRHDRHGVMAPARRYGAANSSPSPIAARRVGRGSSARCTTRIRSSL